MMKQMKGDQLTSDYVKEYYDNFLSKDKTPYHIHRWHMSAVHEEHFIQTKRTLERAYRNLSGSVLEIGGGDGMWTKIYIEKCSNLTYLDISNEMLSQARENLKGYSNKIDFRQGDFLQNGIQDQSFDNLISIRNFEYFKDKDFAIKEMCRLLKKGGSLFVVTKSKDYNLRTNLHNKTLHSDQVSIKSFIKKLELNGFEIIDAKPAIFGKLLRMGLFRFIFRSLHSIFLVTNWKILPVGLLSIFSESYYVEARKK